MVGLSDCGSSEGKMTVAWRAERKRERRTESLSTRGTDRVNVERWKSFFKMRHWQVCKWCTEFFFLGATMFNPIHHDWDSLARPPATWRINRTMIPPGWVSFWCLGLEMMSSWGRTQWQQRQQPAALLLHWRHRCTEKRKRQALQTFFIYFNKFK